MTAQLRKRQQIIAGVDLGSNSFHLIVAAVEADASLRVIDRLREAVRLGEGLGERRELTAGAQQRALEALGRFGDRLREVDAANVRAVGTNTLREARIAPDFLQACEAALGHPIEVVSGFEEARLVYQGVAHHLGFDARQRLVIDIGGGSTELILGAGYETHALESLQTGCVALSGEDVGLDRITGEAFGAAVTRARLELEPVETRFRAAGWSEAVGASGTVRSVADVLAREGWTSEGVITREGLEALRARLLADGCVGATERACLSPDRQHVFPAGVAILVALFEGLGLERLEVAEGALREGLLCDLVGRMRTGDIRDRTVASLARRYHVDTDHAQQVRATAEALLAAVDAAPPAMARSLLGWAASLHEIGLDISHSGYHKHGAYILEHADLAGFSRQEQQVLAVLVRAHRRKIPRKALGRLPERWQGLAARLALILRLAVLLHRGRAPDLRPRPTLRLDGDEAELVFEPGYLERSPLLRADLERERGYWARSGITLRVR